MTRATRAGSSPWPSTVRRPHMSYHQWDSELRHAYRDETGWHVEVVDSNQYAGWDTSIAVDSAGLARISYYDMLTSAI